MKILCPVRAS